MLDLTGYEATSRAAAAYGLPRPGLAFPDRPLVGDAWKAFSMISSEQRLQGLVGFAIADGALRATDEQIAAVRKAEIDAAYLAVRLEQVLLEVWEHLTAAKLTVRVIKGPALAHTAYPITGLRYFGDIDLLLAGDEFDRALALLADGTRRNYDEPRRGFTQRFGKGASLLRDDGYEVDIHRTFVMGPYGLLVDTDALFAGGTPFILGGATLLGLSRPAQFVGACYHAILGARPAKLIPLRDVLQLALTPDFDLPAARALWRTWRGDAVVALAVQRACAVLGVEPSFELAQWASAYEPTPRERRYLSLYLDSSRSYARLAIAGIGAVHGIRAKASYIAALAAPNHDYLDSRDGSYFRRAWRAGRLTVTRSGR